MLEKMKKRINLEQRLGILKERIENLPDRHKGQWTTKPHFIEGHHKSYPYLVCRNPYLFTNLGYVGISKESKVWNDSQLCDKIACHGGITFDTGMPRINEELRIIGIDGAHVGDFIPCMSMFHNPELDKFTIKESYKTLEYMKNQCFEIIEQLIELEKITDGS